jgi:glycosyltransferase involved in cell wall biosynthesis
MSAPADSEGLVAPATAPPHGRDVALVAQAAVRGHGQGRVVLELARALALRGHHVTVYAHDVAEELSGLVRVHRIPRAAPGPQVLDDLFTLAWATIAVRRAHHEVCCVVGPTALPRRPFLLDLQFSHRGWRATWGRTGKPARRHRLAARVAAALEAVSCRLADAVIVSSRVLAADLGLGREVRVVPNGVDLDEYRPPSAEARRKARCRLGVAPDEVLVAFLGEYTTNRKGLDPLLRAVSLGPERERLLVAAPGPTARLRAQVAELGLERRVVVAPDERARSAYDAADVVAVPSLYEPFSLVSLEAAACGLPVVLSRRAGAAELLEGAVEIVDDPESPLALRQALDRVEQPDVAARLGRAARARVESLSWPAALTGALEAIEALSPRTGPRTTRARP